MNMNMNMAGVGVGGQEGEDDTTTGQPSSSTRLPFICNICNKSFGRPNNLKSHMLSHSAEKPFKCDYCDQAFVRAYDQRRHQRSHTDGNKAFVCEYCNKGFTWVLRRAPARLWNGADWTGRRGANFPSFISTYLDCIHSQSSSQTSTLLFSLVSFTRSPGLASLRSARSAATTRSLATKGSSSRLLPSARIWTRRRPSRTVPNALPPHPRQPLPPSILPL